MKRWVSLMLVLGACSSELDTAVENLGHPGRREQAQQRLLIAKDQAVEPLLEALAELDRGDARPELAQVLVGLLVRTGDKRIVTDLSERLANDPDGAVRARIARAAGLHRRKEFIEPLLEHGLSDSHDEAVYQALVAIGLLRAELTPEQEQYLVDTSASLVTNEHKGVRTEARLLAEKRVAELVEQGRARAVQAELAAAESLFHEAIAIVPDNKYANYRLARLRYDEGDRAEGLRRLREHGMLLDVPRTTRAPQLDGRVTDDEWRGAAHDSGFYSYVGSHSAAIPSLVETDIYLMWDDDALYIGFIGHDDAPGDLVTAADDRDDDLWYEDIVEIYLDANHDRQSYVHMGINSRGIPADAWHPDGLGDQDEDWNADMDIAAHVGEQAWSLELAIGFGDRRLPKPVADTVWGFNFVRTYRGSEYSQWVRTFAGGGHAPDDFGFLVFTETTR